MIPTKFRRQKETDHLIRVRVQLTKYWRKALEEEKESRHMEQTLRRAENLEMQDEVLDKNRLPSNL